MCNDKDKKKLHIFPRKDALRHSHGKDCWCVPRVIGGRFVVHKKALNDVCRWKIKLVSP